MKTLNLTVLLYVILTITLFSQDLRDEGENNLGNRHFVGSSLWSIYDKFASDPSGFYQLNYGYHYTETDVFLVEAITWGYDEPLGTYENSKEKYPGKVRSYGIGFGYQKFLWKNLYSSVIAIPFLQQYFKKDGGNMQKGFQLYTQLIIGYRFEFFNDRLFIEPAYGFKYWPIDTNVPESFAKISKGTKNYIIEPSLNFGYSF